MKYRVELTTRANRDLEDIYQHIHAADVPPAADWFNGLEKALRTLERFPRRCPITPEAHKLRLSLRHLLYGKKPHIYRVIYQIDDSQRIVHVLTISHGAQDEFPRGPRT